MQKLFNDLMRGQDPETHFDEKELLEELETKTYDKNLCEQIYEGVKSTVEELDKIINEYAPAWPIPNIATVDLILLRMGIWEAFIGKLNPEKVVINEYIELAKAFGGARSGPFINGVLGNIHIQKGEKVEDEQGKAA